MPGTLLWDFSTSKAYDLLPGADYLVAISSSMGAIGPVCPASLLSPDGTSTSHDAWLNHTVGSVTKSGKKCPARNTAVLAP
jgi:hypothetical protein